MSYNILYPHESKWGPDYRWRPRARSLTALIARHAPDLAGLQEVADGQLEQIQAALPRYGAVTIRGGPGAATAPAFANPVLYRPGRLRLVRAGWRWLAAPGAEAAALAAPPEPDSAPGWANRHALWALFEDRQTGSVFCHVNTHFAPGRFRDTHPASAAALVKIMAALAGDRPRIVTGDFNNRDNLLAADGLADARSACAAAGPDGSKVDRQRHEVKPGSTIDHIFFSPGIVVHNFETIDERRIEGGAYPSDHLPIMAAISFPSDLPGDLPGSDPGKALIVKG